MNCSTVRRNVLAQESPATPGAAAAGHLAGCSACRAWHRRLVSIERHLPLLAVPACPVPPALLGSLQHPPLRLFSASRPAGRSRHREVGRKKLALAFSLAASLAVFTLGWWAWPHEPPTHRPGAPLTDPYASRRDARFARAATAPQRVEALADLAADFLAEARKKGHDPAGVAALAGHFDRLVREDLIHHVGLVTLAERREVASKAAQRFGQVESEASRLAAEWTTQHLDAAAFLRRIAASARDAESRLRRFA